MSAGVSRRIEIAQSRHHADSEFLILGLVVLARRVGRTADEMAARLAANPNLRAASPFGDRAVAESSIAHVLDAIQAAIQKWLSEGGSSVFSAGFDDAVGTVWARGATGPVSATNVSVALRPSSEFATGFRIHTVCLDP